MRSTWSASKGVVSPALASSTVSGRQIVSVFATNDAASTRKARRHTSERRPSESGPKWSVPQNII